MRVRDTTRLEPSGKFFSLLLLFNCTNEYLKVLCLRIETSAVAGKGNGARDKQGAQDTTGIFFLVIFYIYYTDDYDKDKLHI
jgi:hypothetical protein